MVKCIFIFLFLTVYLQCVFAVTKLDYMKGENFQIGISSIGVRLSNSTDTQCGRELQIFLESFEENKLWALKLIDSFGVIPKSFHWGNYFWYSSKELCEDLNEPFRISLSDRYNHTNTFNTTSPFSVRFWMIYLNFTSPVYVDFKLDVENYIHVGLCLPQSCPQEEVMHYSQTYFAQKSFAVQQRFDVQMDVVGGKSPEFKWSYLLKTGVVISFLYLALWTIFTIVADRIHKNHSKISNKEKQKLTDKLSRMEQFFLCFHLEDNLRRTLGNENRKGFLTAVAGLRTIVCMWITLSHVFYFSIIGMNNVMVIMAKLEYLIFQPVLQGIFYEDVFFIMSSFLMVYKFLSNVEQMKTIKANSLKANLVFFLRQILDRYLRFLPLMLATMVLVDGLYDLLDMYSPLRMDKFSLVSWNENWWYNILFINNFLSFKYMCCLWMWYLACEMQYFIFFTAILIIFAKNESFGKSLFKVLLVAGVVTSFLCHYHYDSTFQIDVIFGTNEQLYTKPWIRINSYTGGALIGWLFCKRKEHPIKLNVFWKSAFWIFTFCLYVGTSFMTYWRVPPTWIVASIMSFGKLIFALCIGGVICMCEWGHGGLLNSLLSSRLLKNINNLCFSIYMLTPLIIVAIFGLQPEAVQGNEINALMYIAVITICSIAVSSIAVLLVELPAEKFRSKFIAARIMKTTQNEKKDE